MVTALDAGLLRGLRNRECNLTPKHFTPTDFVHGIGNGKNRVMASRSLRDHDCHAGKKQQGSAPHPAGAGRSLVAFYLVAMGIDGSS